MDNKYTQCVYMSKLNKAFSGVEYEAKEHIKSAACGAICAGYCKQEYLVPLSDTKSKTIQELVQKNTEYEKNLRELKLALLQLHEVPNAARDNWKEHISKDLRLPVAQLYSMYCALELEYDEFLRTEI